MDKNTITELENFIFGHKVKPGVAASVVADCLGVIIGVKPAAIYHFEAEEFAEINPDECIEIFKNVGLKALFFRQKYTSMGKLIWVEDVYVSRSIETANRLHQTFIKLRETIDDVGQTCDQKGWEDCSREIGRLLGYPETAIDYFITEQNVDNEERKQLMRRYHFYVHSPKHHEQEYQIYDRKILQTIRVYTSKTASELLSDNQ